MGQAVKRKIIKHAVIIIILCIPMGLIFFAVINAISPTYYETEIVTAVEPCVYVTEYGKKYHSAGCSYLAKSLHAVGKQEAISNGYTACSRCGGKPSGTITVGYTKRVEVDGRYRNIVCATVLSALCTPIAYFIIYAVIQDRRGV